LAISADSENWLLVNASPELRYQIESSPFLHPRPTSFRHSPIQGVVLTSAELDAALGLLLLRESQPLIVYATEAVRQLLTEDNNLFDVLRRLPDQVQWRTMIPGEPFELHSSRGTPMGMVLTAFQRRADFPVTCRKKEQGIWIRPGRSWACSCNMARSELPSFRERRGLRPNGRKSSRVAT